jgi:hypothetical protein
MTPERWQQVEELFHAAQEKEVRERAAFVAQACEEDEDLRREVETLLAQRDLNVPETVTAQALSPGTLLGPYRLDASSAPAAWPGLQTYDTRLARSVAIKVGLERFSERFQRKRAPSRPESSAYLHTSRYWPRLPGHGALEGNPLKGPFRLDKVIEYGSQICDGLDAAHRRGIVHRDLKPANILVTRRGIKDSGFCLAKMASQETLTQPGAVMGTPAYMAPEQRQGKEADLRADIYSLGRVLYEMATGERTSHRELQPAALESRGEHVPGIGPGGTVAISAGGKVSAGISWAVAH